MGEEATDDVWTYTNEEVEAVVRGLQPKETDKVAAICGAGYVPLALLEYADTVWAIDNNPYQIAYVQRQIERFRENPKAILHQDLYDSTRKWFTEEGRLERIQARLGRLHLVEGSIYENGNLCPGRTQVYLSNAIGVGHARYLIDGEAGASMERAAERLQIGARMYFTNGNTVLFYDGGHTCLPGGWRTDKKRTRNIAKYELGIGPLVIKKTKKLTKQHEEHKRWMQQWETRRSQSL